MFWGLPARALPAQPAVRGVIGVAGGGAAAPQALPLSARPVVFVVSIALSVLLMGLLLAHVLVNPRVDEVMKGVYTLLFSALFYCCIAYQLNRLGAARREGQGGPEPIAPEDGPRVAVLIPSFREERRVLLATVLSAALARYGDRRVVVLVDDPPADPARSVTLDAINDVAAWLAEPMDALRSARAEWLDRASGPFDAALEAERLAGHFHFAADFLDGLGKCLEAESEAAFTHVDGFLRDTVVATLARHYRSEADRMLAGPADRAEVDSQYRRLGQLFCDDITAFERKRFDNLPHAANKAMNLNAYIGLMGGRYRVVQGQRGPILIAVDAEEPADLDVPSAEYVLTLDADSIIAPDYIVELMALIAADGGIGVVQTPYRAFPGATAPVERIAGATTDMQYLVHQGSTHFRAAFWVGANALIRMEALKAIAVEQTERGHRHKVFVQDQTVIEDTGSTIDLLGHGYRVHNHFRPLAFSATPADFGSLAVQRQRWSNGGLIIFPQLWCEIGWRGLLRRPIEFALRAHYLLSPAIGNTAVFLLMVLLSTDASNLLLMPLAMAPYFIIYGLDLRRSGYRFSDIFSVSALNLMLLPVGFAGVAASIRQMVTGEKGTFWRTPKIAGRTRVHWFYIVFCAGLVALMGYYLAEGVRAGDVLESLFPALNLLLLVYGFVRFIGVWAAIVDLAMPLISLPATIFSTIPKPLRRLGVASVLGLGAALVPVSLGPAISGPDRAGPPPGELDAQFAVATDPLALWHPALPPADQAIVGVWLKIEDEALQFFAGEAFAAGLEALPPSPTPGLPRLPAWTGRAGS
jgi:cellulose synthase (UDP-forming)